MPINSENVDFEAVFEMIQERVGITLNEYRRKEVVHYITSQLTMPSDIVALRQEMQQLPLTDVKWRHLIGFITVGETYFFRNQVHFQALREHLLPRLIEQRRLEDRKQIRIWNAGCATGEEPYSLAILLSELIPDIEAWSIVLLATDINQQYLEKARDGQYTERAFRNETPATLRGKWFTQVGKVYQIDRRIREMVTFLPLNLIEDVYPSYQNGTGNMDLIMCRNVTIYFTRQQTERVIKHFYDAVNPNGWLIVGHSEPQPGIYDAFENKRVGNAILYQKPMPVLAPTLSAPAPKTIRTPVLPSRTIQPQNLFPARPQTEPTEKATQSVAEGSASPLWEKALLAANQERWEEALGLLDEAEAQDNLQPQVHYIRALIHLNHQQMDCVFTSLRQAIYCDPDFAMAHYTLGDLFAQQKNARQAERHWRRALAIVCAMASDTPLWMPDMTAGVLQELITYQLEQGK